MLHAQFDAGVVAQRTTAAFRRMMDYLRDSARQAMRIYLPSLAVLLIGLVVLTPTVGADGAAFALLASTLLTHTGMSVVCVRMLRSGLPSVPYPAGSQSTPIPPQSP